MVTESWFRKRSSPREHLPEILVTTLGLLISVTVYGLAERWETQRQETQVHEDVAVYADALEAMLGHLIEDVQTLAQFYDASDTVREDQFTRFTQPILKRHPALRALEWEPRVRESERKIFEAQARAETGGAFTIWERVGDTPHPAGSRSEYFPVYRIEPLAGNAPALGFDAGSEPLRRTALEQARDTGLPVVSAPLRLIQDTEQHQRSLVIVAPQMRGGVLEDTQEGRRERLQGFAVGVLRLGDLVEGMVAHQSPRSLDLLLWDPEQSGEAHVLAVHASRTGASGAVLDLTHFTQHPLAQERSLTVAGRTFVLRGVPAPGAYAPSRYPLTLLGLGLCTSLALTLMIRHRRRLGEQEVLFRLFMDHSPAIAWIKDEEGRYVYLNRTYERYFGVRLSDWQGKADADVWPAEMAAAFREADQITLAGRRPLEIRESTPTAEGLLYHWQTLKIPFHDRMGRGYVGGIALDVTERHQAEVALRASEAALKDAQRLAGLGYWSWDMETDAHAWSEEIFHLYGRDPRLPPAVYPEVQRYFTPESWARLAAAVERARTEGLAYECEAEVVRPEGEHGWIVSRGEATRNAEGRIVKLSGTVLDITARKRAELASQQAQARFQRLMDANAIGVIIAKTSGEIPEANDYYLNLVGYTRAELEAGMVSWRDLTPPEWLPGDEKAILELQERGISTPHEKEYLRRDGSRAAVLLVDTLLPESGSILALALDISERKQAEEQLRAGLEEKTVLVKEIHHRVKNNLQVIVSLLSLQAAQVQNADTRGALRDMQGRIHSMALLHETLYQRGAMGGRVDGAVYLTRLCDQLGQSFGLMAGRVRIEHQLTSLELTIDQAITCGLIVNELVSNAFKHAFPGAHGGQIRVVLAVAGDGHRVLAVGDDGVGMPPGLDWRNSASLGLQLAPGLARQLGGELELQPGPGTLFSLTFPGP